MGGAEETLHWLAGLLARALDPVAMQLDRLDSAIRHQLAGAGVPFGWQTPIIATVWGIVLFLVFRSAPGWLRVVLLIAVAAILARIYGVLPRG